MHEFKRRFPPPPTDWSRPRLDEIADRVTARNVEGNPNVLTISAEFGLISQSEFFSRRVASESVSGYFLLQRGDFAYNKSYSSGYPLGAIRRLDRYEKGCVSPLYICFRPNADAVDSDFLLHYLDGGAIDAGLADVAKEGVRNHGLLNVGVSDFFGLEVPLPPLAEQRAVAQVLDGLDSTIRHTEAIIEKLKRIKQGLLHDLLTRGIGSNGELRPPPSQAPHLYKDSTLGLIPREWREAPLGEIADLQVGFAFRSEWFRDSGDVRLLRGDNVGYGSPDWSAAKFLAESLVAQFSEYALNAGDVVVGMDRSFTKSGAKFSLVDDADLPCLLVQRVGRFIATDCESSFLRILTLWPDFHRRLMAQQKGMDIPHLSKTEILEPRVPVPAAGEQIEIAGRIGASEASLEAEVRAAKKLKLLKSGLMDDLLTGRVRVTPLLA